MAPNLDRVGAALELPPIWWVGSMGTIYLAKWFAPSWHWQADVVNIPSKIIFLHGCWRLSHGQPRGFGSERHRLSRTTPLKRLLLRVRTACLETRSILGWSC